MTVSKSRGVTKRLGPISVGSKIVRFKVHNIDRRFAVHEDLICRTSTLFKTQLQKNRKVLPPSADDEECCVCQEDLNPNTKDITYCVTCGQNVHDSCIEQWKQISNNPSPDRHAPTCPMCRATWKNEPLLKYLSIDTALDASAVQAYLDYLYSGDLYISPTLSRKCDPFNVALLKCWAVAAAVSDAAFKHAVIRTFFTEAKARFWSDSVKWAWTGGHGTQEIKDFVMEVFMAFMQPGWFKSEAAKWDEGFVRDMADRALEGMEKRGYREVRMEWMRRLEMEEGMEVEMVEREEILETKTMEGGKKKEFHTGVRSKSHVVGGSAAESRTPALEANRRRPDEFDDWDLSRFVGLRS